MAPVPAAASTHSTLFILAIPIAFGIVSIILGICCASGRGSDRSLQASLAPTSKSIVKAREGAERIDSSGSAKLPTSVSGAMDNGYGTFADFDGIQAAAYISLNFGSPPLVRPQDLTASQPEAIMRTRSLPYATRNAVRAGVDLSSPPIVCAGDLTDSQLTAVRQHQSCPATVTVCGVHVQNHISSMCSDSSSNLQPGLIVASGSQQPNPPDGIQIIRRFGPSGEGQATLVKQCSTGKLFVVKEIPVSRKCATGRGNLPAEVRAFTQYLQRSHPNIVVFHSCNLCPNENASASGGICQITLEYCSGGDLAVYCNKLLEMQVYTSPLFVLHFIASMSDALAFIHLGCGPSGIDGIATPPDHHQPFLHLDIKPGNVFLRWTGSDEYGMPTIVLGDWGFSTLERKSRGMCGTPGLIVPEAGRVWDLCDTDSEAYWTACSSQVMTRASDIYTFGATLYTLIFTTNFDNRTFTTDSTTSASNAFEPPGLAEDFATTDFARLPAVLRTMQCCFVENPRHRITTETLYSLTPQIKRLIADIYAAGYRWTDHAPRPQQTVLSPGELPSSWSSSEFSSLARQRDISVCGAADSSDPTTSTKAKASQVHNTDRMSQISGFSDTFCWCTNHRSLSSRRPGPGCVREEVGAEPHVVSE